MRYTAAFKLNGPLAAAAAVEWTDVAAPLTSGAGWEACVKLPNGDWRFSSHAIVPGDEAYWRDPGLFGNIGLRYRLSSTGPWSPISTTRKEIMLVEVIEEPVVFPPALTASQWSALETVDLGTGFFTAAFTLSAAPAAAEAAQWTRAGDPAAQADAWQPCLALGAGRWRLDSADGTHKCREGERLGNIGLRYRLAAGGAWSPVSEDRKALSVPRTLIPPLAVTAPALTGAGKIGTAVVLAPGLWTGTPVPSLAQQWQRGGVDIPGAVLASYTPVPADDRSDLTCRVTASSLAGTAVATAGPIRITHVAPVAAGNLFEEVFDQGSGAQTVAAAGDFTGLALSFAVTGARASIDAVTGVVSIPTDVALSGETVTVTASNSGGSAASSFMVTVEAAEVELPPAPMVGEWDVYWDYDFEYPENITWHIKVISGPVTDATRIFFRGEATVDASHTVGAGFNCCVRHPSKAGVWVLRAGLTGTVASWLWCNSSTTKYNIMGQQKSQMIIYTLDDLLVPTEAAVYSPPSNVITKIVALDTPAARTGPYVRAPYHVAAQKAAGSAPCDTEQVCLGFARAKSEPGRIYAGGDMHGVWVSLDSGRSWNTLRNRGLGTPNVYSLEVDPTDANKVIAVCGARYSTNNADAGIYRSLDGGLTWARVFVWAGFGEPRKTMKRLAYAPSTAAGGTGAIRWYAVFDSAGQFGGGTNTAVPGLITSADGGATWTKVGNLAEASFGTDIYGCRVHPTVPTRLFLWGTKGLVRIDNAHSGDTSSSVLSGAGGLPAGSVRGDLYLSADGAIMIVAVAGKGVYKSTNSGAAWSLLLNWADATHCCVNEGFPKYIYSWAQGDNEGANPRISHDGGATWFQPTAQTSFPGLGGKALVGGNEPWIMADPSNPLRAVCHAHADFMGTEDGGVTWSAADSAYFCGTHPNSYAAPHCFDRTDPLKYIIPLIDRHLMDTSDGGVTNVVRSFKDLGSASGYTHGTVNGAAVHPDGQHIIACVNTGTKGLLCYSEDRGNSWEVTDPGEKPRMYLGYDAGDANYAYQFNRRSQDKGKTWTTLGNMPSESYIVGVSETAVAGKSVIYAADLGASGSSGGTKKKIYKSLDRGNSWSLVATTTYSLRAATDTRVVFRVHPKNPHVIFTKGATTDNKSAIRRWDTSNLSAVSSTEFDVLKGITASGPFYAQNFCLDGYNPDVMYFMSNQGETGNCLFMSTNAGSTWTNISAGFPNITILSTGLEVHPLTGVLYLGTANGMFVRKPPYPVPTPKNTYDLIVSNYDYWDHNRHFEEKYWQG